MPRRNERQAPDSQKNTNHYTPDGRSSGVETTRCRTRKMKLTLKGRGLKIEAFFQRNRPRPFKAAYF